jgi:hypothetical protein
MSKRTGRAGPEDTNEAAFRVVQQLTGALPSLELPNESVKARAGRLGGLKGGSVRAGSLSAEERSEIARGAARARWEKRDEKAADK